jgi:hypothetical protein
MGHVYKASGVEMMNFPILESACSIDSEAIAPASLNYKLDSWPPREDFPIIVDAEGNIISRFADSIWKLWPWCDKSVVINFMDKAHRNRKPSITIENAKILRVLAAWLIYGPAPVRRASSLTRKMQTLKALFTIASREGILITEISKFPKVIETCALEIPPLVGASLIPMLHQLLCDSEVIGFIIMDRAALRKYASLCPPSRDSQTAYIPPRIWNYQISRLEEFITDFLSHRKALISCFKYCLECYAEFYGSLESSFTDVARERKNGTPFSPKTRKGRDESAGRFSSIASSHGILKLLEKWVVPENLSIDSGGRGVIMFTTYLSMANAVCLSHILNFSLMRISEAWSLKVDCLEKEVDPIFGAIYIVKGITTKTADDDDSRWIVSPSVTRSIEVATCVGKLRSMCEQSNTGIIKIGKPNPDRFLFIRAQEPWSNLQQQIESVRPIHPSYNSVITSFPKLFDSKELTVTANDMQMALLITPTLNSERIGDGMVWPLAWHQLRRTGAVNMQASGLVSDSSIQYQLKHITRGMSLYYGRGYSQLRLSESARSQYVKAMYEMLAHELNLLQSDRFISPYGQPRKDQILRLVSESDQKKLIGAAKSGRVAWRPTLLGGCTKRGHCEYGGIDNIARCCGGDGRPPCTDVLIDSTKLLLIKSFSAIVEERLTDATDGSPYKSSLQAQKCAIENALNLIYKDQGES